MERGECNSHLLSNLLCKSEKLVMDYLLGLKSMLFEPLNSGKMYLQT